MYIVDVVIAFFTQHLIFSSCIPEFGLLVIHSLRMTGPNNDPDTYNYINYISLRIRSYHKILTRQKLQFKR